MVAIPTTLLAFLSVYSFAGNGLATQARDQAFGWVDSYVECSRSLAAFASVGVWLLTADWDPWRFAGGAPCATALETVSVGGGVGRGGPGWTLREVAGWKLELPFLGDTAGLLASLFVLLPTFPVFD